LRSYHFIGKFGQDVFQTGLGAVDFVFILPGMAERLGKVLAQLMVFGAHALGQLHQLSEFAFQYVQFTLHGTNYSLKNPDESNANGWLCKYFGGRGNLCGLCYNARRFKVLRDLSHAVKRETGEVPVLPPQR
jgi:hypothetical protein